ncbi:hypothetical protein B4113_1649 [Geobacillus sp. B4113_201601]|nr:hypothetical protein B4113_1649 [Geobacillus sp. B4113_201601]
MRNDIGKLYTSLNHQPPRKNRLIFARKVGKVRKNMKKPFFLIVSCIKSKS